MGARAQGYVLGRFSSSILRARVEGSGIRMKVPDAIGVSGNKPWPSDSDRKRVDVIKDGEKRCRTRTGTSPCATRRSAIFSVYLIDLHSAIAYDEGSSISLRMSV